MRCESCSGRWLVGLHELERRSSGHVGVPDGDGGGKGARGCANLRLLPMKVKPYCEGQRRLM